MHYHQLCSLNKNDYIQIIASMKYLFEKNFQCNFTDKYMHMGKLVDQARIDLIRKRNGCFNKLRTKDLFHKHNDIRFERCVCNFYDSKINILLRLNDYYKINQSLPEYYMYKAGNIPSKLLQAIKIVDNYLEDKKATEIKKQQESIKNGKK